MRAELPWRVGELARRTGITVRTLHHYDEIGLLRPARRTAAGHRLYGREDVARLQLIRSLRLLGLSLDEIRDCLERRGVSLRQVLELQLEEVERQIELEVDLRDRLRGLVRHLAARRTPSAAALVETLETMTKMESHFTKEQRETLKRRRAALGEEHIRAVEAEWPELIRKVRAEMERGTDPADARVQALVRRWTELVAEFTGGDPGVARGVASVYQQEGPALRRQQGDAVPSPELFAYVQKAQTAGKT